MRKCNKTVSFFLTYEDGLSECLFEVFEIFRSLVTWIDTSIIMPHCFCFIKHRFQEKYILVFSRLNMRWVRHPFSQMCVSPIKHHTNRIMYSNTIYHGSKQPK